MRTAAAVRGAGEEGGGGAGAAAGGRGGDFDEVDTFEYELPSDFEDEEVDSDDAFNSEDEAAFGHLDWGRGSRGQEEEEGSSGEESPSEEGEDDEEDGEGGEGEGAGQGAAPRDALDELGVPGLDAAAEMAGSLTALLLLAWLFQVVVIV